MDDLWKALTALFAVLAGLIAYQQARVAREKLKLDLFDRRFKVFAAARQFLGAPWARAR